MNWVDLSILLFWALFVITWLAKQNATKSTIERQGLAKRVAYSLPAFVGWSIVFVGLSGVPHPAAFGPPVASALFARWLGVCLALGGLLLAIWARATLGQNWSAEVELKRGHELVTHGPYAWVRHPIYAGLLLMVGGTVIAVGTRGSLAGLPLICLGGWIRLSQEETLMLRHFPAAYPAYRRRAKRIIPFVL